MSFQLPLSGSHDPENFGSYKLPHHAFNSLSRDHPHHLFALYHYAELCFQLPLSGSQPPERIKPELPEQPFNSLSRDHLDEGLLLLKAEIAFNSLSRDHGADYERIDVVDGIAFNSLSRDHLIYKAEELPSRFGKLSTPSLGITRSSAILKAHTVS